MTGRATGNRVRDALTELRVRVMSERDAVLRVLGPEHKGIVGDTYRSVLGLIEVRIESAVDDEPMQCRECDEPDPDGIYYCAECTQGWGS